MKKLIVLALSLQIGCASITASRMDSLRVNASPPTALVSINGQAPSAVPVTLNIPREGRRSVVDISAPGFRSATCDTKMVAGGGYVAADVVLCVLLFPLGCISFIDASGAWNELASPICDMRLAPETPSSNQAGSTQSR